MPLASQTGVSYQNGFQYRPHARVLVSFGEELHR